MSRITIHYTNGEVINYDDVEGISYYHGMITVILGYNKLYVPYFNIYYITEEGIA